MTRSPTFHRDVDRLVDDVIADVGKDIVLGMPLGLGKPNHFTNALYRRAAADPSLKLTVFTALTLQRPAASSDLERRFLEPLNERLFGTYPEIEYAPAAANNTLPPNVDVYEFYFRPGAGLDSPGAQRNYISVNYTHAVGALVARGVNVLGQLVGKRTVDGVTTYSLGGNTDTTLDLVPILERRRANGTNFAFVAEVNTNMPFMTGDAEKPASAFDYILDDSQYEFELFGTPYRPVAIEDYAIGLHAASLVKDGGTLQIGIGSMGEAITYCLTLRQTSNDVYRSGLAALDAEGQRKLQSAPPPELDRFDEGLYGSSEMFVDGFMHLMKSGVLKRQVYEDEALQALINDGEIGHEVTLATLRKLREQGAVRAPLNEDDVTYLKKFGVFREDVVYRDGYIETDEHARLSADIDNEDALTRLGETCLGDRLKGGVRLHAGFFLGPRDFYQALRDLSDGEREAIKMVGVSYVNQLYGNERLKRLQRQHARFINSAMIATLSGAVASDGLEDGRVVSGVGGQYNFVAMAHELEGARSIIALRSTREKNGGVSSNIRWNYGHTTIPRHLRDIIVTEYGVADLRAKSDREVVAALLNITDSRFQNELLAKAKSVGKIERSYEIPEAYRHNLPERIEAALAPVKAQGVFQAFPFGNDLTEEEVVLGRALRHLAAQMGSKLKAAGAVAKAMTAGEAPAEYRPYLARMALDEPKNLQERLYQRLLTNALRDTHPLDVAKAS